MAVKPRQNVPAELDFLLPDKVTQPILIGDIAYDLMPLTEGEFEQLSMEITKLFDVVYVKGEKSPIEYLMQGNVLVSMLGVALKPLALEEIRAKLTAKQMMYIASIVWTMNFETIGFTEDVKANFQKVLGWVGFAAVQSPSQKIAEKE